MDSTQKSQPISIAIALAVVIVLGVAAWGYTEYQQAEQSKASLATAQAQASQLKDQLSQLKDQNADLQNQNSSLQDQNSNLTEQLSQSQGQAVATEAELSKPDLPVSISFRRAILGPGLVAIFRNNSGTMLEFSALFSSPTTGRRSRTVLVLNPNAVREIGTGQGWPFAPGQQITLNNPNFRPIEMTVP